MTLTSRPLRARVQPPSPTRHSGGGAKALLFLAVLAAVAAAGYIGLRPYLPGARPGPAPSGSSGNAAVIIGDGDYRLLTGADGDSRVRQCDPATVINNKRCGDVKMVVIDAQRMPYIARNISLAWTEGRPSVLHRETDVGRRKYEQNCLRFVARYPGVGSCDEFPFASSREGGTGARVEEVHITEQRCQGGTISTAYQYQNVQEGDEYVVIISHPESIPSQAWAGQPNLADSC